MLVLIAENGRKIIVHNLDSDLQTDLGVIRKTKLTKAKTGDIIESHNGKKFRVISGSFLDLYESLKRGPQIITLKDMAYIAGIAGVRDGYKIVDAGVGTGALSLFLAMSCAPKGKVIAYDNDERSIKVANENIKRSGLANIKVKKKDIYAGISEKDLDLITLDLPEPWNVNPSNLKHGGFLIAYLPNMNQVQRFAKEIRNKGLEVIEVTELIKRDWKVKGLILRPEHQMLGHTGFLVVCRKL